MKKARQTFRILTLVLTAVVFLSVWRTAYGAEDFSPTTIKASGTSRVEGENWMAGGQGVAFYERTYQTDPRAYASPRGQRPEDTKNESQFVPQSQAWSGASNGMMLGWMDANEWVRYEINVEEAGTYLVGLLVGTGYKNVIVDVYLDADPEGGTLLGSIEVVCNGFYNMMLQSIGEVSLPEGSHTLKVLVRHSKGLDGLNLVGVDVDYIQFTRIRAGVPDDEPYIPPETAAPPPESSTSSTEPSQPETKEAVPADSQGSDPLEIAVIVSSAILLLTVTALSVYCVANTKKHSR